MTEMKIVECCCEAKKKFKVFDCVIYIKAESGYSNDTDVGAYRIGETFKYCPFCGKEIEVTW